MTDPAIVELFGMDDGLVLFETHTGDLMCHESHIDGDGVPTEGDMCVVDGFSVDRLFSMVLRDDDPYDVIAMRGASISGPYAKTRLSDPTERWIPYSNDVVRQIWVDANAEDLLDRMPLSSITTPITAHTVIEFGQDTLLDGVPVTEREISLEDATEIAQNVCENLDTKAPLFNESIDDRVDEQMLAEIRAFYDEDDD